MIINKAILLYGHSNFSLEILEYCKPEQCLIKEQYYLDNLPHEYNILPTAGSSLGRRHSDETRQKMREARLAYHAKDPAALAKMQAAGAAASAAACSKAVLVTNIETGTTVEYVSQKAAAIALEVSPMAIYKCLKRQNLLKKIYIVTRKSSD